MFRRKIAAAAVAGAMVFSLTACMGDDGGSDGGGGEGSGDLIGVAMPTKSSERWIKDGDSVKADLEGKGYKVDLQYAEDDIPMQVSQIENMITKGAKLLIIASIDGTALTSVLQQAKDNEIPVIAYDRLIRNSPNVDYYTTFDNYQVGVQQGSSLLTGLGVLDAEGNETGVAGPFNVELFAGSPDDNNATFFYDGMMDTIKPFLDSGVLVVKSGQTDFQTIATMRWDPNTAQSRMENLLTANYSDGTMIDGVLSPFDGISIGILGALKGVGYGTADQPYPTVTGQDAEAPSVKSIIAGEQYSTIFKDTSKLGKQAVQMAEDILNGKTPETNDDETYDNGEKVVPSYLLESVIVTADNYQEVLIDSGYYTEADLS